MKRPVHKKDSKSKKNSPNWAAVLVPLLIFFLVGWMVWRLFQPAQIETYEGVELLRSDTVERVVVNDPAQRV